MKQAAKAAVQLLADASKGKLDIIQIAIGLFGGALLVLLLVILSGHFH